MSTKPYVAGYKKCFGDRVLNVSHTTTEGEIKEVYKKWASNYDEETLKTAKAVSHRPQSECLHAAIEPVFQDKPKREIKIIDVGAGTGLNGVELKKLGYTNLHALDISQEMLDEAKKKDVYKKFICAALSDQRIPEIETGEYDALICCGTPAIGHVRACAFVEMIRMVKIGGLLGFNIRFGEMDDYQEKMLELEEAGRWEKFSEKTVPHYDRDDMPRNSVMFVYKVLKNQ